MIQAIRATGRAAHVGALATRTGFALGGKLELIGLYGSEPGRRALLFLPSGKAVKVRVGDEIQAGTVVEIGEDYLVIAKGGRRLTLTVAPLG